MNKVREAFNNRLSKKEPPITVEYIIKAFQDQQYDLCIEKLLYSIDRKERIQFLVDRVSKSKFKSYFTAYRDFKQLMDKYLEENSMLGLQDYLKTLDSSVAASWTNDNQFYTLRKSIVMALITDKVKYAIDALSILINYDLVYMDDNYEQKLTQRAKTIVTELVAIKWPGNNALRILFG